MRRTKRAIAILVLGLLALRLYAEIVPLGASPLPWLLARINGPVLSSPARVAVSISYNDAGAMHSGDHWCWIVQRHWLLGNRVVASGYIGAGIAVENPSAWNWMDGRTLQAPSEPRPQASSRRQPRLPRVIRIGG
ncbi:MAG TPA: hypothetical protein VFF65_10410 [Phycisphaerales bacterium]|nr:hypothetical protein [Phycisphaerales bacterium]